MKKSLSLLALSTFMLAAVPAQAAPETYILDPQHTNIVWHANHFGFSNPSGRFTETEGTLILDEEAPEASQISVTINPASIMTGIPDFDKHLKSADFLHVEEHGTATFISDNVEVTSEDAAKVHGNLTLLGVTKPVVLDVTLNKIGENPMDQTKTAGFSGSTTIKRSDFGIDYALPGVSDEVQIDLEVEARRE